VGWIPEVTGNLSGASHAIGLTIAIGIAVKVGVDGNAEGQEEKD